MIMNANVTVQKDPVAIRLTAVLDEMSQEISELNRLEATGTISKRFREYRGEFLTMDFCLTESLTLARNGRVHEAYNPLGKARVARDAAQAVYLQPLLERNHQDVISGNIPSHYKALIELPAKRCADNEEMAIRVIQEELNR